MKRIPLFFAALAVPASIALAQTPPSDSSSIPFIPLIGSTSGGTSGTTANSSTWFIDVSARQVVLCTQSGATSFTCTSQPVPAAPSSGGTPPAGDAGTPPATGAPVTPDASTPPATGAPS